MIRLLIKLIVILGLIGLIYVAGEAILGEVEIMK
jgi:hypothetical protein